MPALTKVLTFEDFHRHWLGVNLDLTPYLEIIDRVAGAGGLGASLRLRDDESRRTEKRRLGAAAKQQGYRLVWRKAAPGEICFVISAPGAPVPGRRRPRTSTLAMRA